MRNLFQLLQSFLRMVGVTLEVAQVLANDGISVEVVDPRSISPLEQYYVPSKDQIVLTVRELVSAHV